MISILHTNDFHGKLSDSKVKTLLALRKQADLYFDSGDGILTGNLGVNILQNPYWAYLSQLRCTASVLGNRETHPIKSLFQKKIDGAQHTILCANLYDKQNSLVLYPYKIVESKGFKIGVIGVMVAMIQKHQKSSIVSSFLWTDPIKTAVEYARQLRNQVDLLFAITHIGYRNDQKLAEYGLFDLILGGHSHTLVHSPGRICQAGSHARFAGFYRFDPVAKKMIEGQLLPI